MAYQALLVINCGSSSVKFSLFSSARKELVSGLAERLGSEEACLSIKDEGGKAQLSLPRAGHEEAIRALLEQLSERGALGTLAAVGHRVVHGGEYFDASVRIDEDVLDKITRCNHLAPLHNPANVLGIQLLRQFFPDLPQVATFDTAFHQTLPEHAFIYGLPYEYYEKFGVRRYGFHGTSHQFVSNEAVKRLQLDPNNHGVLCAHLGNGCSATAVRNGKSIDTSMGLTPLEGLVMGTRSGDVDPSVHQFLAAQLKVDLAEITSILNSKSGLLGISGVSNDMRTLCDEANRGHVRAELAINVFCYRLAKTLGALAIPLGRLDALVFTGGIGENAALIREKTLSYLSLLGFVVDAALNAKNGDVLGVITGDKSPPAIVIATQEEWMIANDALNLL